MRNKTIITSLIHNESKERLQIIKPNIEKLNFFLKKNNFFSDIFESYYQPELSKSSLLIKLRRDFGHLILNRQWNYYKKIKNRFVVFDFLLFLLRSMRFLLLSKVRKEKYLKMCSREIFLSNKHIDCVFNAFYKNSDFLLVFEDDAVFKKDSINKVVNFISNIQSDSSIYVDLAGGIKESDLKISRLIFKKDDLFKYFLKPATNTSCCYLMNKNQIKIFCDFLIKFPNLRYLNADWMFNKIFILQDKYNIKSVCLHSDPSFFNHGSVTGEFKSLVR